MKTLKFVHRTQLAEYLALGWAVHGKPRKVAMWLRWEGEGTPRYPEPVKLMYGLGPGGTGHPNEYGSD